VTAEPTDARAPAREALIADRLHEADYTSANWPAERKKGGHPGGPLPANLWCYALDLESGEPLWPEPLGLWRRDGWNRHGARVLPREGVLEALTGAGPAAAKELAHRLLDRARGYRKSYPGWFPAEESE